MSLRTAMVVFVTCRRSESKCFFRSYVFADCGHEDKRKCKSNIVCLCGLQWLCLLRVGDLKVNVSSGRMSLRTAMIVLVKCRRSESKCFCRSYVFADCNGCVLLRRQEKIEKQYCMSLRTAMIVFVKCRRSESKCFKRSYVFADCNDCVC